MRNIIRFSLYTLVTLLLQGCFGVGIDTSGKREADIVNPMINLSKNPLASGERSVYFRNYSRPQTTSSDLFTEWGKPESYKCEAAGKEIWAYTEKYPTSNLSVLFLIIPIPIWSYSANNEITFEISDGVVTKAHLKTYGEKFACYSLMVLNEGIGTWHPESVCGYKKINDGDLVRLLDSPKLTTRLKNKSTKVNLC